MDRTVVCPLLGAELESSLLQNNITVSIPEVGICALSLRFSATNDLTRQRGDTKWTLLYTMKFFSQTWPIFVLKFADDLKIPPTSTYFALFLRVLFNHASILATCYYSESAKRRECPPLLIWILLDQGFLGRILTIWTGSGQFSNFHKKYLFSKCSVLLLQFDIHAF